MTFNKLTWVGLMIAALGWTLLISGPAFRDLLGFTGPSKIPDLAPTTVISGFALALLGALQSGFGALNRFFESVLQRTTRPAETAAVPPVVASPRDRNLEAVAQAIPKAAPKPAPKKVLERGRLKDRAYVLFIDGSVEIETLLGLRRFPSLRDAQDFIS